jgi:acyl transferase domain-containing protein
VFERGQERTSELLGCESALPQLHDPLSRLILEGPADELDRTVNAQPAILATSVAFLEAMREEANAAGVSFAPLAVAGHSAGQYAAAVAADAIDFADAVRLVRALADVSGGGLGGPGTESGWGAYRGPNGEDGRGEDEGRRGRDGRDGRPTTEAGEQR